jgi:hypothetical protein
MTDKAAALSSTDEIQVGFVPGRSVSSLAHTENTHDKPNSSAYEVV